MAARWHRPTTMVPNRDQASASPNTTTSMTGQQHPHIQVCQLDEDHRRPAKPRRSRACARAGEAEFSRSTQIDRSTVELHFERDQRRGLRPPEMAGASPIWGLLEMRRVRVWVWVWREWWADRARPIRFNPWVDLAGRPRGIFVLSLTNFNPST
jgi:hypothetical protein